MTIKILYFGRLAETVGVRQAELDLTGGDALLETVRQQLISSHPALDDPTIRIAVNQTLANENLTINDGDELAFFPPVSGG
ncbi:MAG TPA: molybdopterin converting factor subunit 1 [Gammaproteobacteria bacterium]|jgi:sulfur-carrier protein|nr:molybdopterin converting factor subunit 1 [Gammaproteobacteria bacterium]